MSLSACSIRIAVIFKRYDQILCIALIQCSQFSSTLMEFRISFSFRHILSYCFEGNSQRPANNRLHLTETQRNIYFFLCLGVVRACLRLVYRWALRCNIALYDRFIPSTILTVIFFIDCWIAGWIGLLYAL